MTERKTRRDVLRLGAAGLAAGVAGCTGQIGGGSSLESQLETVASETEQFSEPGAALEAGFQVAGPVAPGQGWHFIHEERVQAAAQEGPDLSEPQVLTYDTDLELVAVEWAVPSEAVDEEPDLFDTEGADATEEWHTHGAATHVLANGDGEATPPDQLGMDDLMTNDNWSAFLPPEQGLEPGDEVSLEWGVEADRESMEDGEARVVDVPATHPAMETLHVWAHEENPEGVFHPTHPDVAGGGDHDH